MVRGAELCGAAFLAKEFILFYPDVTAPLAAAAGANVTVSGSYIFLSAAGVAAALGILDEALLANGD